MFTSTGWDMELAETCSEHGVRHGALLKHVQKLEQSDGPH